MIRCTYLPLHGLPALRLCFKVCYISSLLNVGNGFGSAIHPASPKNHQMYRL